MKEKRTENVEEEKTPKMDWQDPKLTFVKPKLNKHGGVKETTAGSFGSFFPPG